MADEAPEKVLEWHRIEHSGGVLKPLVAGGIVIFIAPLCGALGYIVFKNDLTMRYVFSGITIACALIGPAIAIVGLQKSLVDEATLAARTSGITYERKGKSVFIPWDQITKIEFQAPTTLIFHRTEGEPFVVPERYGTISAEELGKKLEELRRKSAFHLLPGQSA
jgi:hypothetical protein